MQVKFGMLESKLSRDPPNGQNSIVRDEQPTANPETFQKAFVSKQIVPSPRTTAPSRALSFSCARSIAAFRIRIRRALVLARDVKQWRCFVENEARSDDMFCFGQGGQNIVGGVPSACSRETQAGIAAGETDMVVVSPWGRR